MSGASRKGSDASATKDAPAHDLPSLDFTTFVLSIIGSAHIHLGDAPPHEGHADQNLVLARQDIDLLGILQEKTKGNLTGEEERLLEHALYDLRMRYLEVAKEAP